MENLRNGREAEVVGYGPLTKTFLEVRIKESGEKFLVWADTGNYRRDNKPHERDFLGVMKEC